MNWKPIYAVLIFLSTFVTWLCGIYLGKTESVTKKKLYLTISLIINFGILFVFKYLNFINDSIYEILKQFHIRWEVPNLDLLLPVGISFYTFQAVGYTIDVYRGSIKAEKHLGIYALFVSFFPQLVAGPIERASSLLPQFREVKFLKFVNVSAGLKMMMWGFFLKIVMADRLALYVNAVFNNVEKHNGASHAIASFLFAFQIYGDFAGYSLIAIGVAKIMDFRLMTNFERPYFAVNTTDFWSRWHISLSTWFKDYLYIPLGGNRVSKTRNYFNLFITFFVSGIWHGANYTFVIWGAIHGFFSFIEKAIGIGKKNIQKKLTGKVLFQMLITFILVDFAWIFFRANNIHDAFYMIKSIFTDFAHVPFIKWEVFFAAGISIFIVLLKEFTDEFYPKKFKLLNNKNPIIEMMSLAILFGLILLLGVFDSGQFIYFQF